MIDLCGYLSRMLITNWEVKVAHQLMYHKITDPSAHHEISCPWAKIGPKPATVVPQQGPLPVPIEPEALSHPATHGASRCLGPAIALKAMGGKDFPISEEKQ